MIILLSELSCLQVKVHQKFYVILGNLKQMYAGQKTAKYLVITNLLEKVHYMLLLKYGF